jgi:probable metal-binding protein
MTDKVHAHEVLAILDQYTAPVSLNDLRTRVTAAFGSNAVFSSCAGDSFSFEQLIDFMTQRQKIIHTEGGIRLNKANVCDH